MLRGRAVVVVLAEPRPGLARIISLRKASGNERKAYENAIRGRENTIQD